MVTITGLADVVAAAEAAAEIDQIGPGEVVETAEVSERAEVRRPW